MKRRSTMIWRRGSGARRKVELGDESPTSFRERIRLLRKQLHDDADAVDDMDQDELRDRLEQEGLDRRVREGKDRRW